MAKFNFSITAHVNNGAMVIYSKDYVFNVTQFNSVLTLAELCMPFRHWSIDDGDDVVGCTYCQYVSYDDNKEDYLLASWYEVDEDDCIIL